MHAQTARMRGKKNTQFTLSVKTASQTRMTILNEMAADGLIQARVFAPVDAKFTGLYIWTTSLLVLFSIHGRDKR